MSDANDSTDLFIRSKYYGSQLHDPAMGFHPFDTHGTDAMVRHHMRYATGSGPLELSKFRQKRAKRSFESDELYVALVFDRAQGRVSKKSSPCLKQYRNEILWDASPKFRDAVQQILSEANFGGTFPGVENVLNQFETAPNSSQVPVSSPTKRRRLNNAKAAHHEPAASDTVDASREDDFPPEGLYTTNSVTFPLSARAEWENWFHDAFRAVQQVSCRVIAKEWIKTIHPKKQSTHPYNGKDPRTGERGDSNATKPPYWPADVIHKEPDHINKEARTKLLVHLLMNTPHQEMSSSGDPKANSEITAEDLKVALEQKKHERTMNELNKKFGILEHIIEVRSRLESYESGGINGSAMLTAVDYSDYNKSDKNEDDMEDSPIELEHEQTVPAGSMNGCEDDPDTSVAQSRMASTTPTTDSLLDILKHENGHQSDARSYAGNANPAKRPKTSRMRSTTKASPSEMPRSNSYHQMNDAHFAGSDLGSGMVAEQEVMMCHKPHVHSPSDETMSGLSQHPSFPFHGVQMPLSTQLGNADAYMHHMMVPDVNVSGLGKPPYAQDMYGFSTMQTHEPHYGGMPGPRYSFDAEHGRFPPYDEQASMTTAEMMQRAYFPV